jgi:putative copper resistance protein D
LDEPLVWVRALHFAATMSVTGGVLFRVVVAEPAFGNDGGHEPVAILVLSRVAWIIWSSLGLAVLSGIAWLFLQAGQIAELPWSTAISQGAVETVLVSTGFGFDWVVRFAIAVILAIALVCIPTKRASHLLIAAAACSLAIALVGTLAWAGHAAATPGSVGVLHVSSDFIHLVAAAAWAGALVPLAILLCGAHRHGIKSAPVFACAALLRFSTLGMISVGLLVVSGLINSWILVGSVSALVKTAYGRLLLAKVSLFFAMLSLAAINRLRLTPVIKSTGPASNTALRRLQRNTLIEAAIAALILIIVGWLGTMPPGFAD